jgi:hypothetical protein
MFNARAVPTLRTIASRMQPVASRSIASSRASAYPESDHSADSYFKDIDSEPPKDSTVHRVDSSSDTVQRPYEPPAGDFSKAGVDAAFKHKNAEKEDPYSTPGDHSEEKMRYGGKESYGSEKKPETSGKGDGPTGASAGGRKPEGRS